MLNELFSCFKVQVRDRNFTQCMHSMRWVDTFSENDTIIQISRCSFDIHVQEVLGSLMFGATSVMLHPHGNVDFDYLSTVLVRKQITFLHTVPSLLLHFFRHIVQQTKRPTMRYIRSLGSTGEPKLMSSSS